MTEEELKQIGARHRKFLDINTDFWLDDECRVHILSDIPKMRAELLILSKLKLEPNSLMMSFDNFLDLKKFTLWWEQKGMLEFSKDHFQAPLQVKIQCLPIS